MSERYVVTGAAGFIASRVSQLLLDAGHEVVGVDDLNEAYDSRLKSWRLETLRKNAGFQFHPLDVSLREPVAALFDRLAAVDRRPFAAVVHLPTNLIAMVRIRRIILLDDLTPSPSPQREGSKG